MTPARYILPPVAAPAQITLRPRIGERDRPLIAAQLATGFRPGDEADPVMRDHVTTLRRLAVAAVERLSATVPSTRLGAVLSTSIALQRALVALPDADRACVGVALVRSLLDDPPDAVADALVSLDRAVRDAAKVHAHMVTTAHAETARGIATGVGL